MGLRMLIGTLAALLVAACAGTEFFSDRNGVLTSAEGRNPALMPEADRTEAPPRESQDA